MVILHPKALWLLMSVPVLALLSLIPFVNRGESSGFGKIRGRERTDPLPSLALYFSITSIVLGLAGPSFERFSTVENYSRVDVGIVLDVSRSMLAEDSTPTRLGRAKQICLELMENFGGRYSLSLFKGDAVTMVPLTDDRFALQDGLKISSPSALSSPGTNISSALKKSVSGQVSRDGAKKVLLLLSDGERPERETEELPDLPFPVFVVGLGTDSGAAIRIGEETFLTDTSGDIVISVRDNEYLKQIARQSGGQYLEGNDPAVSTRLAEILRNLETETATRPTAEVPEGAGLEADASALQKDNFRAFILAALFFLFPHIILKVVKWHVI